MMHLRASIFGGGDGNLRVHGPPRISVYYHVTGSRFRSFEQRAWKEQRSFHHPHVAPYKRLFSASRNGSKIHVELSAYPDPAS